MSTIPATASAFDVSELSVALETTVSAQQQQQGETTVATTAIAVESSVDIVDGTFTLLAGDNEETDGINITTPTDTDAVTEETTTTTSTPRYKNKNNNSDFATGGSTTPATIGNNNSRIIVETATTPFETPFTLTSSISSVDGGDGSSGAPRSLFTTNRHLGSSTTTTATTGPNSLHKRITANRLNLTLPRDLHNENITSTIGTTTTTATTSLLCADSSSGATTTSASTTNFADIVKERTRVRREREDAALSNLTVQVGRLEAALQTESKRRSKAVVEIQQQAKREIQQMEEMIRKQMQEETILVEQRLVSIENRISQLEQRWNNDVNAISTDLERNRREIDNQLKEFYNQTKRERELRIQQEAILQQQVTEIANNYQERWTTERQERISSVMSTEELITDQKRYYEQIISSYEQKIQQELHTLIQDIEQEVIERQNNDNEIVNALNRYTAQLQQTLSYATSG